MKLSDSSRIGFVMGLTLLVVLSGSVTVEGYEQSYLLIAKVNKLPSGFEADVEATGGTVVSTIPQIGIAVVESSSPDFAAEAESNVKGVRSVIPNIRLSWLDESVAQVNNYNDAEVEAPDGISDWLLPLQWSLDAMHAQEAWETGALGTGIRVAVLDTGMFYNPAIDPAMHPDFGDNVNIDLAASFVPGEDWSNLGVAGWHGTYIAGVIAAVDNPDDFGVIGVAPQAEIVPVKVLSRFGWGRINFLLAGIVYAADIEADIINMSLAGRMRHRGHLYENNPDNPDDDVWVSARQHSEMLVALNRATNYAYQAGVTIVASAGNSGLDFDEDQDWVIWPAQANHVIAVSATAPELWALYPDTDLDVPASYTNHGQSGIHIAAPGGDFDMQEDPRGLELIPVPYGIFVPAWAIDMVIGPRWYPWVGYRWVWTAGTSPSAAHVSGVAALIIGQNGGSMHPAHVEVVLKKSADDLGKPGQDDFYGHGRVNVGAALEIVTSSRGDVNFDGKIDFKDFSKLAQHWQKNKPSVDIAPGPDGDGIVDFQDVAVLAWYWLEDNSF
jgi:subtilisin family serine protease